MMLSSAFIVLFPTVQQYMYILNMEQSKENTLESIQLLHINEVFPNKLSGQYYWCSYVT
jgi:hypothetical protein